MISSSGLKAIEVLLVEDNPNDAELTMRALDRNKLVDKVYVLNDGSDALDFIFAKGEYAGRDTNWSPKVILLDLKLPKFDGLEVLREIKSNPATKSIPVVILTSSQEERGLVESYKLGANSYIVKPVDFDIFTKVIADLGLYWLVMNKTSY